jgi:hypothetical protein
MIMNNLTRELRDWIKSDSLSGGLYENCLDNEKDFEYSEEPGRSRIICEDIGLSSTIFELTVENFLNSIYKCSSYVQYCRRCLGKKFKDFTIKDCLELSDRFCEKYGCSIFGCGSDETSNEKVMKIDGVDYLLEYSRY